MATVIQKLVPALSIFCVVMLISQPAHALRCGSSLVKEGMPEARVIAICGEPVSRQQLGLVMRPYILKIPAGKPGIHSTRHVFSGYHQQLLVTELLFNFGPRKLMRIVRFEGDRLTSIETAGYGYWEKDT